MMSDLCLYQQHRWWTEGTCRGTTWSPDAQRTSTENWLSRGARLWTHRPLRRTDTNRWRKLWRKHTSAARETPTPPCPPPGGSSSPSQTWRPLLRSQTPDLLPVQQQRCGSWSVTNRRWCFFIYIYIFSWHSWDVFLYNIFFGIWSSVFGFHCRRFQKGSTGMAQRNSWLSLLSSIRLKCSLRSWNIWPSPSPWLVHRADQSSVFLRTIFNLSMLKKPKIWAF